MANDPATADLDPTAAENPSANQEPARNAGNDGTTAAGSEAGNNPSSDTENQAARDLLKGATSVAELQRLLEQGGVHDIPTDGTVPAAAPESEPVEETIDDPDGEAGADAADDRLPNRVRLNGLDRLRHQAVLSIVRGNPLTPEQLQAISANAAAPGDQPSAAVPPRTTAATPPVTPPREFLADLQAKIDALDDQRSTAYEESDMPGIGRLTREIKALQSRLPEVQRAETQYFDAQKRAWDDNFQRASEIYPDARDPKSELSREMTRLQSEWETTGHVLAETVEAPLHLAAMAAINVGVAPIMKGAKTPPAAPVLKPAPSTVAGPRARQPGEAPISPAAGGARTTAPAPDAENQRARELVQSMSPEEMKTFMMTLG